MDMKNGLAGCGVVVVDNTEPLFSKAPLPAYLRCNLENMPDQGVVLSIEIKSIDNMLVWNNEEMMGCNRCDILDNHNLLVLEHLPGRYLPPRYLAEQTIIHQIFLVSSNG